MEFVNPGFLYGLFAVSIPVIIHLFNFRRFRKVYFTNVAFIRELKQETQKQSKLKHLLVLLARMLAIAVLVIAFARPYIPVSDNVIQLEEKQAVSIFIDNSFSMQAGSEQGNLLSDAKDKALEIAGVYKPSDRLQLLTNDFEGKHQRLVSRDEFSELLESVEISPVVRKFSEVMTRQADILQREPTETKTAFVISDFQKGFLTGNDLTEDTSIHYFLIPLEAMQTSNLYIDSLWFDVPVQQREQLVELHVRLKNSSDNSFEKIPVKLTMNGFQKSLASFDILAGETREITMPYTNPGTGIQQGKLEINDHSITFDDSFFFSYRVSPVINVLSINGDGSNVYLRSFFRQDTTFKFTNVSEGMVDYSSIEDYDMVILNELSQIASGLAQTMQEFIENSGSVLVIPSENAPLESYNEFIADVGQGRYEVFDTTDFRIDYINLDHPVYADVFDDIPENIDLPLVMEGYRISFPSRSDHEVLLRMQNGNPFLSVQNYGEGKLYLFSAPFRRNAGNFVQHAIFVPTLYKISVASIAIDKLYYTIGEDESIRVGGIDPGDEEPLKIISNQYNFEAIPGYRLLGGGVEIYTHGQVRQAGNYTLNHDGQAIKGLAFNYNRNESEMSFATTDEIEKWIEDNQLGHVHLFRSQDKPFSQAVTDLSRGIQLWKWFILAALLFFLVEILLLRFMK